MEKRTLLTECADSIGIIAKVTRCCFEHRLNIVRQDQFASAEDVKFFMRTELEGEFADSAGFLEAVRAQLPPGAQVRLNDARRRRLCVLVTREPHCLGELLMKCHCGTLNASIACVIGNYPDLGELCARFGVPFHHISCEGLSQAAQEQRVCAVLDEFAPDYVILAKYMRVLSHEMVAHFPPSGIINIHHSFLPAFAGARPYEQAFTRGVKLIGATAHFVTDNLDAGPIICQDVIRVSHRYNPRDLAAAGHDVEQMVLLKAVGKVIEDKVFVHGNKTVVF